MTPPGQYVAVLTRDGYFQSVVLPAHQLMYMRLAPSEQHAAALAFASRDGKPDTYLWGADVANLEIAVDGHAYFGLGFAGSIAGSLASAIDSFLAPWSMTIHMNNGDWLHLYRQRGPAPGAEVLAAVQARCISALEPPGRSQARERRAALQEREELERLEMDLDVHLEDLEEAARQADEGYDGVYVLQDHRSAALRSVDWQDFAWHLCGQDDELLSAFRQHLHSSYEPTDYTTVDTALKYRWLARELDREYWEVDDAWPSLTDVTFPSYPDRIAPDLEAPVDITDDDLAAVELAKDVANGRAVNTPVSDRLALHAGRLLRVMGLAQAVRGQDPARLWLDRAHELEDEAQKHIDAPFGNLDVDGLMVAHLVSMADYPNSGPDWGGHAIALAGADHELVVLYRSHLWIASLASPCEDLSRWLRLRSAEIAFCLKDLGFPEVVLPGRRIEHRRRR